MTIMFCEQYNIHSEILELVVGQSLLFSDLFICRHLVRNVPCTNLIMSLMAIFRC